ncbi:hypothetical protein [Leucobacter manosquensis]|uniref:Uncharacterized protein n=1 Tax=Leucobacter manosquensis TaxID=2810611 RepID=A0ABS5M9F3_9MICO|nr:hypothetical protein [Leucobacter manosquensis]MBS3183450.1 hypothetical protein [Leucobacter manosquensis]
MTITAEHLTITLENGRELTDRTPVELAHKWAGAEHSEDWQQLSAAKQSIEITAALEALNRAAQEHSE